MEGRLLERIMNAERPADDASRDRLAARVVSIGSYLGRLLNTRQGSNATTPDLGLPDITNFTRAFGSDGVHELEEHITRVVSRYEPRLRDVRVSANPQDNTAFRLAFSLSATIENEGQFLPVLFETILLPDGRIEIRGHTARPAHV